MMEMERMIMEAEEQSTKPDVREDRSYLVDKRRVAPEVRRAFNIKQLWQRNHEIINLAAQGYFQNDIAEILNIHPQTVSLTLNSDLGRAKLSEIRGARDDEAKKTAERIRVLTAKALNVYDDILSAENEEVSIMNRGKIATNFINNVSGLKAPVKIQSQNINTYITPEKLEEFKRRGSEAMREAGIINAEVINNNDNS